MSLNCDFALLSIFSTIYSLLDSYFISLSLSNILLVLVISCLYRYYILSCLSILNVSIDIIRWSVFDIYLLEYWADDEDSP